jgi:hypothetical protein
MSVVTQLFFFKLLKKSTTCFDPFLGGPSSVLDTRISEKIHILQCGHQEWGNEISFYYVCGGLDVHIVVYEFSPTF